MNRTLILYSTKYGCTEEIAKKLALVLGPAAYDTPSGFDGRYQDFDSVVICSPVYAEQILPEIREFITVQRVWLRTKKTALIAVGLMASAKACFAEAQKLLGDAVVYTNAVGGVLNPAVLDAGDLQAMQRFCAMTGFVLDYRDARDNSAFAALAMELKRIFKNTRNMPQENLKKSMEDFLAAHNTCALCTGHEGEVRATPIEYNYHQGAMYFLSEGGEKFAHLLANPRVSIAVFDAYAGFHKLGGLQLTGEAEIIPAESGEYKEILVLKGLDENKIKKLPVALNLIKVRLVRGELLSSQLARQGYDAKQSIEF